MFVDIGNSKSGVEADFKVRYGDSSGREKEA